MAKQKLTKAELELEHLADELRPMWEKADAYYLLRFKAKESLIPSEFRTAPMSLAEAGMKLGLGSQNRNPGKRREAAGKAMRRAIDAGSIRCEQVSEHKFVFDSRQVSF